MSYSSDTGGTLTLPSPTHGHHVDVVGSAVRSLRRSLSRSPSKFSLSRTAASQAASQAASPSGDHPPSTPAASVQSPWRQDQSHYFQLNRQEPATSLPLATSYPQQTPSQTPSSTPFSRPSIKLSARPKPLASSSKQLSRTRVSPKSPLKRVFGDAPDSGNATPAPAPSFGIEAFGQENINFHDFALALSPVSRRKLEKPSRHSVHLDVSGSSSKLSSPQFLDVKSETYPQTTASPLKRSDAIRHLGQTSMGSPVAKRRSLHGISSLTQDVNVFDPPSQAQPQAPIHDDANQEYQLSSSINPSSLRELASSPTPTAMGARRSTSLRKSTLQQRPGAVDTRSSWGRRQGERHLSQIAGSATPAPGSRPLRLSLNDAFDPPSPLPNPSFHPMERPPHQPHPLSRTLTQSSSGSSMPDESPTHFPVPVVNKPRAAFARSLPVGAQRPPLVSTPAYKHAVPLESAFMSTGLISKMNRNPEQAPGQPGGGKLVMPDTPCKRQSYSHATYPPQPPSGRRQARGSFGSPTTPFNAPVRPARGATFGDGAKFNSVFQPIRPAHSRRQSLLSLDGEDSGNGESEYPPTPTKNLFRKTPASSVQPRDTPDASRAFPPPTSAVGRGNEHVSSHLSCKSAHLITSIDEDDEAGSPAPADGRDALGEVSASPSFYKSLAPSHVSRAKRGTSSVPAPLVAVAVAPLFSFLPQDQAKMYRNAPASPLDRIELPQELSPHTPQESMLPPDPSRLSICNSQEATRFDGKAIQPPATPTTHGRDQLSSSFGHGRVSMTPVHANKASSLDESLLVRFDKAEIVGQGEFSIVYRVTKSANLPLFARSMSTPGKHFASSPGGQRVYAVKKISMPYYGAKDREIKLREVKALKSLSSSNYVVHFVDSWEYNGHLYIQTEFCVEGALDKFLKYAGGDGRLDDFRIWKIALDILHGLNAVHEANFVHLDLKPANVLIGFDGSLKLGDFGMATPWPPPRHAEAEGDREYMAPEVLNGAIEKTSDIFSLGLILVEVACNVFMPDNGPAWVSLREGDLSCVIPLTNPDAAKIDRDANGFPIVAHSVGVSPLHPDEELEARLSLSRSEPQGGFPFGPTEQLTAHTARTLFGTRRRHELQESPQFMAEKDHPHSLDNVVRQMIRPNPADRPTAAELLRFPGLSWVSQRRMAGATVYEGKWGPADEPATVDTEMTDV